MYPLRNARKRSPFSGVMYSRWGELWTKHVLNRLSAHAKKDNRTGLVWVEAEAISASARPTTGR